jgi:hypothetical protein
MRKLPTDLPCHDRNKVHIPYAHAGTNGVIVFINGRDRSAHKLLAVILPTEKDMFANPT